MVDPDQTNGNRTIRGQTDLQARQLANKADKLRWTILSLQAREKMQCTLMHTHSTGSSTDTNLVMMNNPGK